MGGGKSNDMDNEKWYFDSASGEVSRGKSAAWDNRMGPYATEQEARDALKRVAERNEAADQWDEDDDWAEPDTR